MGMHWLRRGERDLFRLPFVLHGHQEILQALKRKPRKENFENRTFDASVIFASQRNAAASTKHRESAEGVRSPSAYPASCPLLLTTPCLRFQWSL